MLSVSRLRYWFAAATILVLVVVAGFYIHAKFRLFRTVKDLPKNLGVDIQQSTDTFSLSKSEGGRTLFTIRASKAVQYKQGGHAELHNVSIVVYGRDSNRFDQIYGDDFEYDPQTGTVAAKGVVHIDLQANPEPEAHPELGLPRELKNPLHLKTSGLVFNQKTGMAKTDEEIAFDITQANGSAQGAYYDSKSNTLTLGSNIVIQTKGPSATRIAARHGIITKSPRRAVLDDTVVERADETISAQKTTLFLRDDNSLDHIVAEGDVRTVAKGETGLTTQAPRAEFFLTPKSQLRSAVMNGGVTFATTGPGQMDGNAGKLVADFGPEAKLQVVHCLDGVRITQQPTPASSGLDANGARLVNANTAQKQNTPARQKDQIELTAQAMDFLVKGGRVLDRAETIGPGQIRMLPQGEQLAKSSTVVTAGRLMALLSRNKLVSVQGATPSRVVQSTQGQPDKVSTSDTIEATFDKAGAISGFVQRGNFEYREGKPGDKVNRAASAAKATYNTGTQMLTLEGAPRVTDAGMTTTADIIRLNRATSDADGQGNVKTTYSSFTAQPNGALLAAADPVHVTAAQMTFTRSTGLARYTGGARLWQGANIVEAPTITFDRDKRGMEAQGTPKARVAVVLVQQGKDGKVTPVNVSAAKLTYTDQQRQARFEGGVTVRSSDGTVTSDLVNVFLKPHGPGAINGTKPPASTPSQLDRIVADGHVLMQQPNRRGTGDKLVYTADDGKFVLTGGPPTITDAQQGTVTGVSLTFYSHDDRVLVEGGGNRAVTTTRVSK